MANRYRGNLSVLIFDNNFIINGRHSLETSLSIVRKIIVWFIKVDVISQDSLVKISFSSLSEFVFVSLVYKPVINGWYSWETSLRNTQFIISRFSNTVGISNISLVKVTSSSSSSSLSELVFVAIEFVANIWG